MCTMGIGLLTISISNTNLKSAESIITSENINTSESIDTAENISTAESVNTEASNETEHTQRDVSNQELKSMPDDAEVAKVANSIDAANKLLIPSPIPTQVPVYAIEEEGYPEIATFIEDYYVAKSNCDVEKLKSISSNPSAVPTKEVLQTITEGIEDYRNIKCYTKKAINEGTYIVYAFHEIKFFGLNTLAPGLSQFYIITDEAGNLKTYDNAMDEELSTYLQARKTDTDVQELMQMTNTMADEAKAKDKDLKTFWEVLDNY